MQYLRQMSVFCNLYTLFIFYILVNVCLQQEEDNFIPDNFMKKDFKREKEHSRPNYRSADSPQYQRRMHQANFTSVILVLMNIHKLCDSISEILTLVSVLESQFPDPISTVHKIYSLVGTEMKIDNCLNIKVNSTTQKTFDGHANLTCNITVKWPEETEFSALGKSKTAATKAACYKIIKWLDQNKKISRKGVVQLYNEQDIEEKLQQPITLNLNIETIIDMKRIISRYDNVSCITFGCTRNNNN